MDRRQTIPIIDQIVILSINKHIPIRTLTNNTSLNSWFRSAFSMGTIVELSLTKGYRFSQNANDRFPIDNDKRDNPSPYIKCSLNGTFR